MREVEGDVQAFVRAGEIALIAPHLEALARDTFKEGRKRGKHHQLGVRRGHREAVGHHGGDLFFDGELELVIGIERLEREVHLCGRREVAINHKHGVGVGLGHQLISRGHAGARRGPLAAGCGQGRFRLGKGFGGNHQILATGGGAGGGGHRDGRQRAPAFQRGLLFPAELQHGVGQQRSQVAALHVAVVMRLAAGQAINEEQALHHGRQVAVAHQAAGQPDGAVHFHAVFGGKSRQLGGDAKALAHLSQRDVLLAGGDDHGGHAFAGEAARFAQGFPERAHVIE